MAENIGDAQISLEVALDQLRKQLMQASAEVEKTIQQTKKDIEINVKTNIQGQLTDQMNSVKQSFEQAQEQVQEFTAEGTTAFQEAGVAVEQYMGRVTGLEGVFAGLTASLGTVLPVAGLVVVVLTEIVIATIALIKFTGDVIDKVKLYIGQNEDLTGALESVKEAAMLVYDGLKDIYEELVERVAHAVVDFIAGLVDIWKEMNNTSGAGYNLLDAIKNLMSTGFNAVIRVVDAVINVFRSFSGQSDDTKSKVDSLTTVVNILAGVLNAVAFVIDKVVKGFEMMGSLASSAVSKLQPVISKITEILEGIAKITQSGLGYLFGVSPEGSWSNSGPMGPDQGNFSNSGEEYGPGNLQGKNAWNLYNNKQQSNSGGKTSTKDEIDDMGKLIEKMQEIVDLRTRDLESITKAVTKQQEYNNEIFKLAGRELELSKQTLNDSIKADKKLEQLKLQSEGDQLKIALFNIEEKYRKEINNINSLKINEETKIKIIKELETKKTKEVEDANLLSNARQISFISAGFNSVINMIGSSFDNMWKSVFGEVNSLFEALMKGIYDSLIDLAASSIFKTIVNLLSGGSAGGVLGFIGSLFGGGGYTGDGQDNEPAGIVHRNEFVVSSLGANIPGNRELLEAMNRGEDVASLVGSFEKRSINSESLRADALGRLTSGFGGGEKIVNINLDGVKVNANINKLSGLSENDWIDIVDNEIIPQISKGLKRSGKEVLDNTIN